ncbi:LuxR C-terminal-related transcriptional regulator [Streptomyces sp. NPDC004647]|uniref:ATP-binding protein n=1 Tax=Streptomyces sp. NPDC004647 TaxID=3154671 RepID=UPI0033B6ECB5
MTFVAPRRHGNTLPADATSFVGRRRELAEAKRLLSNTRLLTLTGVGGVGKTRLGLKIAAEVDRAFPDGVWLVELAALTDERLLANTVSDELGIIQQSRPAVEALCDFLADRQLLLVLDNCEHLLDTCANLAERLLQAAPGLRILATSRQPLAVRGESILEVPPLPVPDPEARVLPGSLAQYDAVTLFLERAGAVRPDFTLSEQNAQTVSRLCHRLDGIPLAIELAAMWLRCLALEQILERLDDQLRLLAGGWRAVPPRQRTLRAAIDWSYELCSPKERLLWARLAVFSGGLDLEAAEEVCAGGGIDRAEMLELISGLVDKSIIRRMQDGGPARYQLLETIRHYGRELLAASGQEVALRRRHRDWFLHLAEETEAAWNHPRQVEWLSRLAKEHSNLRAALEFSLTDPGGARPALAIGSALWPYWLASGAFTEARHWLGQALARDPEPTPVRAKALWAGAWYAIQQGHVQEALPLLADCRRLALELGDETALAWATQWSGQAAMFQGDIPRAVELFSEALERHRALGNESGWVVGMYMLAQATSWQGDPRSAELGEELLAFCQERGLSWSTSYALWVLGLEMLRQGNLSRATDLFRESARLRYAFHDRLGIALCIEALAWTAGAQDLHAQAADLLGAARVFWRVVGASPARYGHFVGAHERCEAQARAAIGDKRFQAAMSRSETLRPDDAVALALGERPTAAAESAMDPTALTPREREIAVLISQGLSNREIAARLVIAQRTAEGHVEHILAKLGFHSRTQIAAWAPEHLGANGG